MRSVTAWNLLNDSIVGINKLFFLIGLAFGMCQLWTAHVLDNIYISSQAGVENSRFAGPGGSVLVSNVSAFPTCNTHTCIQFASAFTYIIGKVSLGFGVWMKSRCMFSFCVGFGCDKYFAIILAVDRHSARWRAEQIYVYQRSVCCRRRRKRIKKNKKFACAERNHMKPILTSRWSVCGRLFMGDRTHMQNIPLYTRAGDKTARYARTFGL